MASLCKTISTDEIEVATRVALHDFNPKIIPEQQSKRQAAISRSVAKACDRVLDEAAALRVKIDRLEIEDESRDAEELGGPENIETSEDTRTNGPTVREPRPTARRRLRPVASADARRRRGH